MSTNVEGLGIGVGGGAVAGVPSANSGSERLELRRVGCYLTESLLKRVLRKIFPDQRKHERIPVPPLVGYLGSVQASKPYELADISTSGFCMLTDERWTPGTEMPITLQMSNVPGESDRECFTVQATVVRSGKDGVGFSILLSENESNAAYGNPLQVRWISRGEMEMFVKRLKEPRQADPAHADSIAEAASDAGRTGPSLSPAFQAPR